MITTWRFVLANWKLILLATLLALIGWQAVQISSVRTELAEERQDRAEESVERERIARRATERNRQIEHERQATAAVLERQKDEAIQNLDARLRDAVGRLQDRPERPPGGSGAAGNPGAEASCTGTGLYRADAAFLIREAAAAARVAAERDYCHDRYDANLQPPTR